MRAQVFWLTYAVVTLSVAACSSSKSGTQDNANRSDASVSDEETGGKTSAAGGRGGTGQAGKSGSGGSSTSSTAAGHTGSTASDNEEDAGPAERTDAGANHAAEGGSGGSAAVATNLPSSGDQLSVCTMAEGDCNKGLACYAPANAISAGRGFCSKLCTMDSDCGGLTPDSAKYTCTTGPGTKTCEVACTGVDDKTSCPAQMTCVQTAAARGPMGRGPAAAAGSGGSAATGAEFRCRYPFETSPAWGPCDDAIHVCDKDLTCSGATAARAGYCAPSCDMDADCKDKPSSGSIAPSCATLVPARGMTKAVKLCVLDCASAKDGCPTGTQCVDGPRVGMGMNAKPEYSRCE